MIVGRNIMVFVSALLMVVLFFHPVYGSFNLKESSGLNDGSYNVIVYRFSHGCVEKTVRNIPYKDVLRIKREFKMIDEEDSDFLSKIALKFKTLVNHGVLSEKGVFDGEDLNLSSIDAVYCAEKPFIYGFFGLLFGSCELSSDVYFNFGMWTFSVFPFIVYGHGSGLVRYYELSGAPVFSGYYALDFSQWVFVMSTTLVGVFLFIPFVSPAGLFAGFSVLTMVAGE